MKLREIILDFTSLLDVIMIILFWFILNYQNETTKIRNKAEQAEQAAIVAQQAAESKQAEAEELLQTATDELELMANANEKQAEILSALMDFDKGMQLNLEIISTKYYWHVSVTRGNEFLGVIEKGEEAKFGMKLREMLSDKGYDPDTTYFAILSYDSSADGSRDALESVTEQLKYVKTGNKHFYYTQLDRRVSGEETT